MGQNVIIPNPNRHFFSGSSLVLWEVGHISKKKINKSHLLILAKPILRVNYSLAEPRISWVPPDRRVHTIKTTEREREKERLTVKLTRWS